MQKKVKISKYKLLRVLGRMAAMAIGYSSSGVAVLKLDTDSGTVLHDHSQIQAMPAYKALTTLFVGAAYDCQFWGEKRLETAPRIRFEDLHLIENSEENWAAEILAGIPENNWDAVLDRAASLAQKKVHHNQGHIDALHKELKAGRSFDQEGFADWMDRREQVYMPVENCWGFG